MANKGIRIVATGRALPTKQLSNDDLSTMVETNDEWITTRTGIKNRFICESETCLSLAVNAAKNALEKSGIDKEELGAVIVATSTAEYAFPSTACMVQRELGLSENVVAFDLSAACTGFMLGMTVANGLFDSISKKYIMVVGAEQLSKIVDYTDRSTCILFGDGAGAVIFERAEGRYTQKSYSRGNDEVLYCKGVGYNDAVLHMQGSEVFKFAVSALPQAIDDVLTAADFDIENVDVIVCHQANERIIRSVQKKYPGYENKFYINIDRYGNTSAASIPIVLDELMEQGKINDNSNILCVGFGAGLTWSGALIESKNYSEQA